MFISILYLYSIKNQVRFLTFRDPEISLGFKIFFIPWEDFFAPMHSVYCFLYFPVRAIIGEAKWWWMTKKESQTTSLRLYSLNLRIVYIYFSSYLESLFSNFIEKRDATSSNLLFFMLLYKIKIDHVFVKEVSSYREVRYYTPGFRGFTCWWRSSFGCPRILLARPRYLAHIDKSQDSYGQQ